MIYEYGKKPRQKISWYWVMMGVMLIFSILGFLYIADYMNQIDVPYMDEAYDHSK